MHHPERKEKDCLNCGTLVQGRYCHICGQENIEPEESFGSLAKEFFYDIFHFDSKFFDTLKYLVTKPGFVSKQYVEGKRARYLNPIRMYLFTSAFFFLVFFSFKNSQLNDHVETPVKLSIKDRREIAEELGEKLKAHPTDTSLQHALALVTDTNRIISEVEVNRVISARTTFSSDGNTYTTIKGYDSLQKTLPPAQQDSWLKKKIIRKYIEFNTRYSGNTNEGVREFIEIFLHKLPYLLFISLPFFALILKLLYIRHKKIYYHGHAIFTLHHYIFSFFILLIVFALIQCANTFHLTIFESIVPFLFLLWAVYLYLEMKNFYGQKRFKTFVKFVLLNFLGFVTMLALLIVFLLFSVFQM